jgi:hypothetical protein
MFFVQAKGYIAMPIRFVTSIKYAVLTLMILLIVGTSAYAQSETPRPHTDFVSSTPLLFVTVENTATNLEEFNNFFSKLAVNSNGDLSFPHLEGSSVSAAIRLIELENDLSQSIKLDDSWLGDQLSLVIQAPYNPSDPYAFLDIFIMIDIKDTDALFQMISANADIVRNDRLTVINEEIIIIDGLFIYANVDDPDAFIQFLESQPNLSSSTAYQTGINNLPNDNYPVTGYVGVDYFANLSGIGVNNLRAYPNQSTPPQFKLNSDMVFGLYTPDERTIAFDFTQPLLTVDDASTININFADNIPANSHIILHSANAEIPLDGLVGLVNQISPFIDDNVIDGYQVFHAGGLIKQAIITAVAGFTGLNIEQDIIQEAEDDYALMLSLVPELQWFEFGFLADIDDDEAIDYIFASLTEAAQAYGVDVTIQERNLHVPDLLKNLMALELGNVPNHPSLELSIIHKDDLLAFGNTPLVNHAIGRDGTLAQQAIYQQAIGHHPNDLVAVLYFNTTALAQDIPMLYSYVDRIAQSHLADLQRLFAQSETLLISTHLQDDSPVSRLTITLPEEAPNLSGTGASNSGE